MSSVEKISILGYKSIRALKDFPLRNLNLLIGANGAGKSNFIGFFRLLHEMQQQSLAEYVALKGGPDALLHFGRKTTAQMKAVCGCVIRQDRMNWNDPGTPQARSFTKSSLTSTATLSSLTSMSQPHPQNG